MNRANTRGSIARHAQSANQANQVGLEYVLVSSSWFELCCRSHLSYLRFKGRIKQLREVSTTGFCLFTQSIVVADVTLLDSHGVPGVSNSAEAAIWMLDFGLSAAANGVARMYLHEGIGFE